MLGIVTTYISLCRQRKGELGFGISGIQKEQGRIRQERKKKNHQYVYNSFCICVCVCLVKAFYTFSSFHLIFSAVFSPTSRRLG